MNFDMNQSTQSHHTNGRREIEVDLKSSEQASTSSSLPSTSRPIGSTVLPLMEAFVSHILDQLLDIHYSHARWLEEEQCCLQRLEEQRHRAILDGMNVKQESSQLSSTSRSPSASRRKRRTKLKHQIEVEYQPSHRNAIFNSLGQRIFNPLARQPPLTASQKANDQNSSLPSLNHASHSASLHDDISNVANATPLDSNNCFASMTHASATIGNKRVRLPAGDNETSTASSTIAIQATVLKYDYHTPSILANDRLCQTDRWQVKSHPTSSGLNGSNRKRKRNADHDGSQEDKSSQADSQPQDGSQFASSNSQNESDYDVSELLEEVHIDSINHANGSALSAPSVPSVPVYHRALRYPTSNGDRSFAGMVTILTHAYTAIQNGTYLQQRLEQEMQNDIALAGQLAVLIFSMLFMSPTMLIAGVIIRTLIYTLLSPSRRSLFNWSLTSYKLLPNS